MESPVSPSSGSAPLTVLLDGSGSYDPDPNDTVASYTFSFGDGRQVTQSAPTVSHTYSSAGSFRPVLQVVDSRDLPGAGPATQTITVNRGAGSTQSGVGNSRLGGALALFSLAVLGGAGLLRRRRRPR